MAAPSPSAGAPPPPPPPISDVVVTSHEVVTATLVSLIGGLFFLVLWAAVRGPMRLIYQKRTQISSLHARPPPLRLDGLLHRCLGYLAPIFLITDGELLETAGLDAMMLCRFLALSLQVFVPTAAVCCAVLIPLTRTGTAVEQNSEYANTASLMRYTLSNVEEGSIKLWAPFALSYLVLAHTAFVLHLHYQSFALLRLLHIRHGVHGATPDISPQMKIVGYERRGWREAAHMLLTTTSAWHMYQDDLRHVRQLVALHQSAELQALHQAAELEPALKHMSSSNDAAELSLVLPRSGGNASVPAAAGGSPHESSFEAQQGAGRQKGEGKVAAVDDAGSDTGGAGGGGLPAVLPWWLPPEQIPPEVSAEYGSSGVLAGKVSCVLRRRVQGTTPAGRHVWSCAAQYAVLWLVEGPPPSQELSSLLRSQGAASQPQAPSIEVHGGSRLDGTPTPPAGRGCGWRQALVARLRSGARSSSSVGNAQAAGPAADAVAAQLEGALRALFPSSFSGLVRVYNHSSCDHLLAKHEHAATQRDCCLTDVAAARCTLDAAEAAATAAAAKIKPGQAAAASAVTNKKLSRRVQAAAAKLAEREAELARRQAETLALEQQVVAARKEALAQPLGTAFIALFRTQAAASMAVHFESSVLPSGNFVVGPAPGPDNINWPALWCPWGQRWWRAVAVVPPLVVAMLFPIGALTGALSNLNTAVCGGTPETNSLYWPWYCNTDNFWVKLVKSLLQSILPSIISTCWDTYVMPLAFYYLAQIERRHVSLRALDRRITVLFYNFAATNTFLGAVLGGTVFMQIGSLLSNPERWLQVLATALPAASTYFIDYTIIHGLCINLFRFVWPHDGTVLFVLFRWVGLFRPRCERDHCMIRSTPSFRAGRHYGSFLLIQIMALSYAVIAPLLLPIATFFFLTAWVAWRYSCLHFYERSYESGGRLFETLFTLVVWTMAIFTTFSSLVLASKKAWSASLIMLITQLPLLYTFHRNVKMSTGHYAKVVPLQATLQAPLAEVDPAMYLPPPLREGAVGWYPEWGKVWEKYGIGRYAW